MTFVSPNCLVPLQMYPYLCRGCVYLYITVTVSVTVTGVVLQYGEVFLILANYRPFDCGGWFPPSSNTGVIKPVVLFFFVHNGLAFSTFRRFFVSFNFCQNFGGLDYRKGAPPSAHRPLCWAQCGVTATYCPPHVAGGALRV